ncbi:phosphotransferase [Steroidobacter sp. S1-65]|uniref:Phosphotransferase n=1 Tax=Steroidobacter gossypii TaxID=2805490 RepID=A0ABS1X1G6_9GAMM|nr:phosphotransferase [Steroidobacter gossypii]MBM0107094.1 phosphotransferase [Steroidobacter gossypii]
MPGPETQPTGSSAASSSASDVSIIDVLPQHRIDEASLWRYLQQHLDDFSGPASLRQFQGGQSNPTYLIQTPGKKFVLRKKPPGKLLPSAHLIEREYRILRALPDTEVPVPCARVLCEDASIIGTPFYVMDHVDGRVITNVTLPNLEPTDRRAIYTDYARVAAKLHSVDYKACGLGDFGKPEGYVARQLDRWSKQYLASKTEENADMNELMTWLAAHLPANDETAIVHGDYRIGNTILHPTEPRIIAVLDWELATLGHPLSDLAYACMFYRIAPSEMGSGGLADVDIAALGIPEEQEFLQLYCQFSGRERIADWPFFLSFAYFRMAAITQGVYARALQGNAADRRAIQYGEHAKGFAAAGRAMTRRGS